MHLLEELESQLPLPIYLSRDLSQTLSQKGLEISPQTELMVTKVLDGGDVAGIMCVIERGDPGAHSDLHNPAAGKAGPSSGGKDFRLPKAEAEKAFPVKGPEPERAQGAGLIGPKARAGKHGSGVLKSISARTGGCF